MTQAYAGAIVDFLDRESGEIKQSILYPITKIVLVNYNGKDIVNGRTFVVEGETGPGKPEIWREVS